MFLDRGSIDLVLVPCGLAIMFTYHLILLYRILYYPETTVVGYENHNKLAWVERMLQATGEETSLALSVISSSTSASSNLASLSIALSSLIGTLVAGSSADQLTAQVIYGDKTRSTTSVKYISLLVCFLVAFTAFIQSARYFVHSSYLMTTLGSDLPVGYVQRAVIRGGNFWAAGLRALYFATVLLMWIFGPIPMFLSSVLMVGVLHLLDSNSMPLHRHCFHRRPSAAKMVATFVDT
ncbi:uncharacterized protein LOC110024335 isoform X2 [Phalaenopsis equestris]|uniref:uncharacterized protein LOC110024335 isoform X2 n=1 Tax=Phalaenopsis equestris TaxID=78828 RepID=UPI0009E45BAB|nr:uncharacterized protein LOC110024335 isoform X2 [Phalaenopsis equestris]